MLYGVNTHRMTAHYKQKCVVLLHNWKYYTIKSNILTYLYCAL